MKKYWSPERLERLKHYPKVPTVAVGVHSLLSGGKHIWQNMRLAAGWKVLSRLNQKHGIDCPSCAWADPDGHRSTMAEYCENGIKAIADEATFKKADMPFFARYSIAQLSDMSDYELGKCGRITHPMILRDGRTHYEPISWDEALDIMASLLRNLPDPDQAVFYTSGRSSNEAAFLYQLFVRGYGTNNLPDCSNLCHESSGVALSETLGIGKGTVTLDDFEHAEVIVIMGQNPGTNHPRMLTSLELAKKKGATIIAVNPLKEPGLIAFSNPQKIGGILGNSVQLADLYLQLRINTDMALLKAVMKLLVEAEDRNPGKVLDPDFIQASTVGYQDLKNDLQQYSLESLIGDTGLSQEEVTSFAEKLIPAKRIMICWAMGLTQHRNAVYTIREITNLLLMKGAIGKPGAGVCPVRGHSNVQGDRTMGITTRPSKSLSAAIARNFGIQVQEKAGYDVVASLEAMQKSQVKFFMALGGNLLSASPDTAYTGAALENCDMTVYVSTKLNRSHLVTGKTALLLPCLGRTDKDIQQGKEQFVSTENSMGVLQKSQGVLNPASSDLRSEPWIVAQLAKRVLLSKYTIPWDQLSEDYDAIRSLIEKTIEGCEELNSNVRKQGGFYLPNGPREQRFTNAERKGKFTVNQWNRSILQEEELLMMTIRSHDQFNTTIYGMDDRYRGIIGERRVIFMNASDVERLGFIPYQLVDIVSYYGQERVARSFKIIEYDIPQGCCATYFPESNPVIPITEFAERSRTPISKSVVIKVRSHSIKKA